MAHRNAAQGLRTTQWVGQPRRGNAAAPAEAVVENGHSGHTPTLRPGLRPRVQPLSHPLPLGNGSSGLHFGPGTRKREAVTSQRVPVGLEVGGYTFPRHPPPSRAQRGWELSLFVSQSPFRKRPLIASGGSGVTSGRPWRRSSGRGPGRRGRRQRGAGRPGGVRQGSEGGKGADALALPAHSQGPALPCGHVRVGEQGKLGRRVPRVLREVPRNGGRQPDAELWPHVLP